MGGPPDAEELLGRAEDSLAALATAVAVLSDALHRPRTKSGGTEEVAATANDALCDLALTLGQLRALTNATLAAAQRLEGDYATQSAQMTHLQLANTHLQKEAAARLLLSAMVSCAVFRRRRRWKLGYPKQQACLVGVKICHITDVLSIAPGLAQYIIGNAHHIALQTMRPFHGVRAMQSDRNGSLVVAFHEAQDAAEWAVAFQSEMMTAPWPMDVLSLPGFQEETDPSGIIFGGPRVSLGIASGPAEVEEPPPAYGCTYTGALLAQVFALVHIAKEREVLIAHRAYQAIQIQQSSTKLSKGHAAKRVPQLLAVSRNEFLLVNAKAELIHTLLPRGLPGRRERPEAKGKAPAMPTVVGTVKGPFWCLTTSPPPNRLLDFGDFALGVGPPWPVPNTDELELAAVLQALRPLRQACDLLEGLGAVDTIAATEAWARRSTAERAALQEQLLQNARPPAAAPTPPPAAGGPAEGGSPRAGNSPREAPLSPKRTTTPRSRVSPVATRAEERGSSPRVRQPGGSRTPVHLRPPEAPGSGGGQRRSVLERRASLCPPTPPGAGSVEPAPVLSASPDTSSIGRRRSDKGVAERGATTSPGASEEPKAGGDGDLLSAAAAAARRRSSVAPASLLADGGGDSMLSVRTQESTASGGRRVSFLPPSPTANEPIISPSMSDAGSLTVDYLPADSPQMAAWEEDWDRSDCATAGAASAWGQRRRSRRGSKPGGGLRASRLNRAVALAELPVKAQPAPVVLTAAQHRTAAKGIT